MARASKVIPPLTVLRLLRASGPAERLRIGARYRVGYYRRQDGLDCVWLVDDEAQYVATADQAYVTLNFHVERSSTESNVYGDNRARLKPLKSALSSKEFLPPMSLLRLIHASKQLGLIRDQVGEFFQVGYYDPTAGLNQVWIADEDGKYSGTIARKNLPKYFKLVWASHEVDFTGIKSLPKLPDELRLEAARRRRLFQ